AAEALGSLGDVSAVEPLIGALGDKNLMVQETAAEALGSLGDVSAVEPLIGALGDKNWSVQRAAAEALGSLGDVSAVEPLIGALGDKNSYTRKAAAKALGKLGEAHWKTWVLGMDNDLLRLGESGDARAFEPLISALKHWHLLVWTAAKALGELGDGRAVEPLIGALGHWDSDVRSSAAWALGALGDARAVEPLVRALGDEKSYTRKAAAKALGELSDTRAVDPLILALTDKDADVRQCAAKALALLGHPEWAQWVKGEDDDFLRLGRSGKSEVVEPLIGALGHWDSDVRSSAAWALGALGDARAVEPLVRALGGKCDGRGAAAKALGELSDTRAVDPLIRALTDKDADVRQCAAKALALLGHPEWARWVKGENDDFLRLGRSGKSEVVEPLIRVLRERDAELREHAVEVLGKLGDTRAVAPLIRALTDEDADVRQCAAEVLGKLGDTRAVEPLIRALNDGDGYGHKIHEAVAKALGELGDTRAVEPLIGALGSEVANVRLRAAEALWALGDVRAIKPLVGVVRDTDWRVMKAAADGLMNLGDARAAGAVSHAIGILFDPNEFSTGFKLMASCYRLLFSTLSPELLAGCTIHEGKIHAKGDDWSFCLVIGSPDEAKLEYVHRAFDTIEGRGLLPPGRRFNSGIVGNKERDLVWTGKVDAAGRLIGIRDMYSVFAEWIKDLPGTSWRMGPSEGGE
ncbi:MAG: HEAT repeat domain-containing protein, partial [Candidatus Alcyoniella australis]|nr:HEAT repeat domain-containing protein [Candidatus Alcyoniella australis]